MSGTSLKVRGKKKYKRIIVYSSGSDDDDVQEVKPVKKKRMEDDLPGPSNYNGKVSPIKKEFATAKKSNEKKSKFYSCPVCPTYWSERKGTMSGHLNSKHKGSKLTPIECVVTDPMEIEKIKRSSKKEHKFPCTVTGCERGYTTSKLLKRHINNDHSEKFRYCCLVCGRMEKGYGNMSSHYKNNHDGIKFNSESSKSLMEFLYQEAEEKGGIVEQPVYSCKMCTKTFEFPILLKFHMSKHALAPRTCPICFRIFKTTKRCRKHRETHDPNAEKFTCTKGDECNFETLWENCLITHEKYSPIHHPEPQFECGLCQRKFHNPRTLQKHQQRPCPPPNQEQRFKCATCRKGYYGEKYLKKHEVKCANGELNLKVPPLSQIRVYRRMINICSEQIHIDACNKNKPKKTASSHLVVVPCNHLGEDGKTCQKKAIMFSSQPTPYIRQLLYSMIRGLACTSLHSHCQGEVHQMDVGNAKFVAGGEDNYQVHMVKKMVVLMAKEEEPPLVTNHSRYEIYHFYDESSINQVVKIMKEYGLSSKEPSVLKKDIKDNLEKILNGGERTVRGHPPLVFKDELFQFERKGEDDIPLETQLEMLDDLEDDDDSGCFDEDEEDEEEEY